MRDKIFDLKNGYIYRSESGRVRSYLDGHIDTYILCSSETKQLRIRDQWGSHETTLNQKFIENTPTVMELIHTTINTSHPTGMNPLSFRTPMWNVFTKTSHFLKFKSVKQKNSFLKMLEGK